MLCFVSAMWQLGLAVVVVSATVHALVDFVFVSFVEVRFPLCVLGTGLIFGWTVGLLFRGSFLCATLV